MLGTQLTPTLRLLRPIGAGGMGTVWAAHHATLDVEVAVKLLRKRYGAEGPDLTRVLREARAAGRTKSPHTVQVIDCGIAEDGTPYLVMELLEGRTLAEHVSRRGSLRPSELLPLVRQIAHALARAHEQGIVHRDLKPSNVFLCNGSDPPFVKLLDFGIAEFTGADATYSATGSAVGTPCAMSPEQLVGAAVIDQRSDIWALGVLVFQALTGRSPYRGETLGALALAVHDGTRPSMCALKPSLPEAFDAWFSRACARRMEDRFPSVAAAMRALEDAANGALESGACIIPTAAARNDPSDPPTLVAAYERELPAGLAAAAISSPGKSRLPRSAWLALAAALGVLTAGQGLRVRGARGSESRLSDRASPASLASPTSPSPAAAASSPASASCASAEGSAIHFATGSSEAATPPPAATLRLAPGPRPKAAHALSSATAARPLVSSSAPTDPAAAAPRPEEFPHERH